MTQKQQIIEYLRATPDGADTKQISQDLGIHKSIVQKIVRESSRIYIDRWLKPAGRGRHKAIHMAVGPDDCSIEDCPPPAKRR
jgi:hypothetical protein